MEISPSLHYRQKGTEGAEKTLKMQDLPGWKPVTPCVLPWECAAPKAHASIRAQAVSLSDLPMMLQMGLEKKHFHSLCGSEQPAKWKVFCLFPRSNLVCRKTSVSHFSFQNVLLRLLVTRSLKISNCFMKKGNLLFSKLFVSWQPLTLYYEHLIYIVTA